MLRPLLYLLACAAVGAADPAAAAAVASFPVVMRSEPITGAELVDPAVTELRVTFDQPMTDGCWSWVTTPFGKCPEGTGRPRYLDDGRTCVLPVRLEPATSYVVGINYGSHHNFRAAHGGRALPWLLRFTTAPAGTGGELEARAGAIAQELGDGRFAAVVARFDQRMRAAVGEDQLAAVWREAAAKGGAFQGFGTVKLDRVDGWRRAVVPCRWQRQPCELRITFDDQGLIAGLFLVPAP
jgi:RNA polymerase sigma-70 factor (ECF subfamily)